jgi:hypothetical protein
MARNIAAVALVAALVAAATAGAKAVIDAGDAQTDGRAKYDFRVTPRVGKATTTFRATFNAPFRSDGEDSNYFLEGVGPPRCPQLLEITLEPTRRGDRVELALTAADDLFFAYRRQRADKRRDAEVRWCRGSYVGYVYFSGLASDRFIGYFSFGVGRSPVSLAP